MAQSIETVQVDIVASSKGASQMLQLLEKRLEGVQSALKAIDTSNLKSISTATKSLNVDTSGMSKAEKSVNDSVDRIKQSLAGLKSYKDAALGGDSSSLTSFNRRVISIQSEIDLLGEKLRQLGDNRIGLNIDTDKFQSYRTALVEIQSELSKTKGEVSSSVSSMNSQQPKLELGETKNNLEEISASARKAASSILSMAGTGIKNSISSLRSHLSKIKDTLTSIGSSSSKGVTSAFSKILKYGFGIRSLYVLFRRLRQAIKDSFTELQNSGADFQTTRANVEALKNSLTTLKYQFGAAFEPIFNTVAPALQTLINYLVAVMNTISAFIAKLTGKSTYSKAVAATGTIAKNTGSAAGSAKELNKQLQGFDELNNLSGDSGSSGGGGSGSGSGSNVTYVEESVDSALSTFWDSLADAISAGQWETVGSMISEKLTSALNGINWDNIYSTASNFGTNFANFLNGLITDDLFSALGTTIGNSINTALTGLNSFGTTFDWTNFGKSIASGINSLVESTDLDLAADTFNKWANGILNTLGTAVQNIDWTQIRDKVCESINKIDTTGIGDKFGTLVNGLANAVYTLVSDKNSWKDLGTKIGDGINAFLNSMSQDNGSGMNGWTATTAGLSSLASGIISSLATTIKTVSWKDVATGIGDMINGIKAEELGLSLGDLVSGIVNAVYTLVSDKQKWKDIGTKIGEGINGFLTSMGSVDSQTGLTGWQALGKDISSAMQGIGNAIIEAIKTVNWEEVGGAIADFLGTVNVGDIAVAITSISAAFELSEAAMTALKALLASEATTVIGSVGTVSAGTVAVSVILAATIGWEIGGYLYESATGNEGASQGFIATVQDLWDGLVGENKIEFNLADFINFTIDDVENGDGWLKTTGLWQSLVKLKTSIENAYNSIFSGSGEESGVAHGYNGAPSEAIPYIESQKVSAYWSDLGKNIVEGIKAGFEAKSQIEYWGSPMLLLFNAIVGAFSDKFDSHSPAKAMYPYGENIFDGIIEGFKEKMRNFNFTELMEELYNYFNGDVKTGQHSNYTTTDTEKATEKLHIKFKTEVDTSGIDEALKSGGTLDKYKEKWGKTQATATFDTNPDTTKAASYTNENGALRKLSSNWKTWGSTAQFDTNPDTQKASNYTRDVLPTLRKNWRSWSTTADYTTSPNTSAAAGFTYTVLPTLRKNWQSWSTTADYTTTPDTSKAADYTRNVLPTLRKNWQSWGTDAYYGTTPDTSKVDEAMDQGGSLYNAYYNWQSWGATATFKVDFSYNENDMNTFSKNLKNKLQEQLRLEMKVSVDSGTGTATVSTKQALGGSFYNGSWHNIPQYAKGGKPNYGSLFVAGEAGPEIVGHLNGRTEVLNKSQIASTIHSAFVSSMAQFGNRMLATPESVAIRSGSYSSYNSSANGDGQTALLAEQNRLLAEQNQLLTEIASKDVSISSRDVFNAVKSESNRFNNRTGGSPFLF